MSLTFPYRGCFAIDYHLLRTLRQGEVSEALKISQQSLQADSASSYEGHIRDLFLNTVFDISPKKANFLHKLGENYGDLNLGLALHITHFAPSKDHKPFNEHSKNILEEACREASSLWNALLSEGVASHLAEQVDFVMCHDFQELFSSTFGCQETRNTMRLEEELNCEVLSHTLSLLPVKHIRHLNGNQEYLGVERANQVFSRANMLLSNKFCSWLENIIERAPAMIQLNSPLFTVLALALLSIGYVPLDGQRIPLIVFNDYLESICPEDQNLDPLPSKHFPLDLQRKLVNGSLRIQDVFFRDVTSF